MKPFHKRKYRRLLVVALLVTIIIVLLDPARLLEDEKGSKVVAFVIDSASSMMKKERSLLDLFDDLTHGQVVCDQLRRYGDPDAPIHHHVAPHYIEHTDDEIGVPNLVTAVLASYRGYDTWGETTVIFTAGVGVILLLGGARTVYQRRRKDDPDSVGGGGAA